MKKAYLYGIVFTSGASVLALEILGTRILGPFYGVSLFLWSALITVTLAALSAGYAIGGRWADRGASLSRLCMLTAAAGVWTILIPWLKYPVLTLTENWGLRIAVLCAASILFVPPLTLLGMVSPYAIKLKTARLQEVGRSAGDLYAVSTIASVLAALMTGFVLIPNIGVNRLTMTIGIVLLLVSAFGLVKNMKTSLRTLVAAAFFVLIGACVLLTPATTANPQQGLLAVKQSPYAEIRVLDAYQRRHMLIDGGVHTIVNPVTWESHFPYVAVMSMAKDYFEQPGKMLLIGLGGGSVVKSFWNDRWEVEAVEIDPVVVEFARSHFGLQDEEGKIHTMDGRQFLLQNDKRYDLIAMDAFGSSSIPFHLVTEESFALIASRLKPNGVLAINTEAIGRRHVLIRSLAATLQQSFAHVLALPAFEAQDRIGNIVLFASDRKLEIKRRSERDLLDLNYPRTPAYHQDRAWHRRYVPDTEGAPVLTDDLNPVDLWAEAINLKARRNLHNYFEESGLSW